MVSLAKTKSKTVEVLISKTLIEQIISHNMFQWIMCLRI